MASEFANNYYSFGGPDITATFNGAQIGTLQGISWSITRERAPQYVMGRVDPVSFARGKRGIAGSLVFLTFDRDSLIQAMKESDRKFWANKSAYHPDEEGISIIGADRGAFADDVATIATDTNDLFSEIREEKTAWYKDQIPPFDITLLGTNEYGFGAVMRIFGVEILNEGGGVSIDDLNLESQVSFVARSVTPWQRIAGGAD